MLIYNVETDDGFIVVETKIILLYRKMIIENDILYSSALGHLNLDLTNYGITCLGIPMLIGQFISLLYVTTSRQDKMKNSNNFPINSVF